MKTTLHIGLSLFLAVAANLAVLADDESSTNQPPRVPAFSVDYMDQSVSPSVDFYHYACGTWLKNNPVPADKSRWAGFDELQQRNWFLIRTILESASQDASA